MNLFPYNNGHLLIAPYKHTASLSDLASKERLELFGLLDKSVTCLKKILRPDGFNIGMNLGRTAGAGIDTHLHLHIVPRWNGDTNFMPVLGETKVISESMESCYKKLKKAFGGTL
jgi:ATP adenylyltransferase